MEKVEKFIQENTRNCSNEILVNGDESYTNIPSKGEYHPWLTPEHARSVAQIAREETLQEVKEKLLMMLNASIDNKHFFEQLDDYIDELKADNER